MNKFTIVIRLRGYSAYRKNTRTELKRTNTQQDIPHTQNQRMEDCQRPYVIFQSVS